MKLLKVTTAALCAFALTGAVAAAAGDLTPTTGESQAIGGVPTGGNQPMSGRSSATMPVTTETMAPRTGTDVQSGGAAPGGAKAGVGGMGSPASR